MHEFGIVKKVLLTVESLAAERHITPHTVVIDISESLMHSVESMVSCFDIVKKESAILRSCRFIVRPAAGDTVKIREFRCPKLK